MALDEISLPLYVESAPLRSQRIMTIPINKNLNQAEREIAKTFGISADNFARADRTVPQGEGGDGLDEKLGDLIHHIDLASEIHHRNNGSPSISLMCASQIASQLRSRLSGATNPIEDDENGDNAALLTRIASHARMPNAPKRR
jgi:hypothetical protein